MVARLYSWDDAGALVLDAVNSSGSLLNILRACLVDGYGTRTAAGWTMPFSDLVNNVGCFKPGNGDDVHLRLNDNLSYQYAYVRGYGSMTDVNTGENEFPTDDLLGAYDSKFWVGKRLSNLDGYERWHVIATDSWFYYWSPDMLKETPAGFFFGKMKTHDPNYTNGYLLTGAYTAPTSTIYNINYYSLFNANLGSWWLMDNYFHVGTPERLLNEYLDQTQFYNPSPADGKLYFSTKQLRSNTTTPYIWYGVQPNKFFALGSNVTVYGNEEHLIINGNNFITVRQGLLLYLFQYDEKIG